MRREVNGEIRELKNDLIDENLKGINKWFERQIRYAAKDAEYEMEKESRLARISDLISKDRLVKRAAMKRFAVRMPGRPLIYFLYSYIIIKGFLDGKDGFMFCMMRDLYQTRGN